MTKNFFCFLVLVFFTANVFAQKKLKKLLHTFLADSAIENTHSGIYLFDAEDKKEILNYQGDKLFVPASNTKLLSLYAGLTHIGDSLPGLFYSNTKDTLYIRPTGDPSFLSADFLTQPVDSLLKQNKKPVIVYSSNSATEPFGKGWTMDDKDASYAPERTIFPVWGNIMNIESLRKNDSIITLKTEVVPEDYQINYSINPTISSAQARRDDANKQVHIEYAAGDSSVKTIIPFETRGVSTTCHLLQKRYGYSFIEKRYDQLPDLKWDTLFSQPADSLYRIMMHRSDNMYAEHVLLMAGNIHWGAQNDDTIRKQMLKEDFSDLPQEPRWYDGSGLSRYNLISPKDLVTVLAKLVHTAGLDRLKTIFPTGGAGTLSNHYQEKKGLIFAKTGSLRNITCLSGWMQTSSNRCILFSVMINNHSASGKAVRKSIEKLLTQVMELY